MLGRIFAFYVFLNFVFEQTEVFAVRSVGVKLATMRNVYIYELILGSPGNPSDQSL